MIRAISILQTSTVTLGKVLVVKIARECILDDLW